MDITDALKDYGPVGAAMFAMWVFSKVLGTRLFSDEMVDNGKGDGGKHPRGYVIRYMERHFGTVDELIVEIKKQGVQLASQTTALMHVEQEAKAQTDLLRGVKSFNDSASEPHNQFSTVATNRAILELADAIQHLAKNDPVKVELYCERVKRTLRRYIKKNGTDSDLEEPLE